MRRVPSGKIPTSVSLSPGSISGFALSNANFERDERFISVSIVTVLNFAVNLNRVICQEVLTLLILNKEFRLHLPALPIMEQQGNSIAIKLKLDRLGL